MHEHLFAYFCIEIFQIQWETYEWKHSKYLIIVFLFVENPDEVTRTKILVN